MLQKALFTAVITATAAISMQASAIGRLADVTVVDRSTGQTLPVHYYRGEYWVAGTPGNKYSVAVANATGQRVLAVMSVDGVNVLNGQTAATDQSGYVFAGHQRYEVNGWRKSNQEVAAFEFVASPASYAERTGRPANVGVIGVALFKEHASQPPVTITPPYSPYRYGPLGGSGAARKSAPAGVGAADSANDGPPSSAAPSTPAPAASASASGELSKRSESRSDTARERLGTGHGEREWSQVSHTTFKRAQSTANEAISIRYDSRENLISMGVIREHHAPWQRTPNPFPESMGYVPDPPRYWR